MVSVEDMRRLRDVPESNRKTYEFALFPGMPHGWMNSTMPGRYRPKETEQAWSMISPKKCAWPEIGRLAGGGSNRRWKMA